VRKRYLDRGTHPRARGITQPCGRWTLSYKKTNPKRKNARLDCPGTRGGGKNLGENMGKNQRGEVRKARYNP